LNDLINKKKIVMVVGGTGGHIYPAIALAQKLLEKNSDINISFIVDKRPLAYNILASHGYTVYRISAAAFPRKNLFNIVKFGCKMLVGLIESLTLLKKLDPDVVVAFGAYFSVPPVLASGIMKFPVVLHEQNYFPGLANRFLTFVASKIAVSYEASLEHFPMNKTVLTGNPIRKEILETSREESLKFFNFERDKLNILIFGGSLGARSINKSVMGILPYIEDMAEQIQIVHICGDNNIAEIEAEYAESGYNVRVYKFLKEMQYAYGVADVIVARAGATTIAEITALGIPAIFIPYPHSTSQHQQLNTIPLCKSGSGICYEEEKLSGEGLALRLKPILKDVNLRREMSIKAGVLSGLFRYGSENLAKLILEYI
jgi:UDP-N-acetylglucosamine--N-acetylmuramyl-(pentapeptide) pyrophosphoryl-undecaprenol N-acetylglucosamine transferase